VTGDIKFAGEGVLECRTGGVERRGTSVGMGYESTNDLCDNFSGGTGEVVDGGDSGSLRSKNRMMVKILLVLSFGWANGPKEGAGRV